MGTVGAEYIIDDGLWCESNLNYHFTAIVPMIYLAEALRNTGYSEDLYKTTTAGGLPHRATPLRGGKAMSAYADTALELTIS